MGILNRGTQVHYVKTKYKRSAMGITKRYYIEKMMDEASTEEEEQEARWAEEEDQEDARIERAISESEDEPTEAEIEEWEIERQIEYQEEKAMGMHD